MNDKVIGWWSGGVTSAITCKLCIDIYGVENVRLIFIDTFNEDEDTYRFKKDCEEWYGKEIETITRIGKGKKYEKIQDVWYKYKSLNVAGGAVCSSELKRQLRKEWEKENTYKAQAFGFDVDEIRRVKSMVLNYKKTAKPIFPLLMYGLSKKDCVQMIQDADLKLPRAYVLGFLNNNCLNTGCVQGGIGYWQKMRRDIPSNFDSMAKVEHELTDMKGEPVTMLKDQSKGGGLVFLKPHPSYPEVKDISMMKGREPQPLTDCNGLACGVKDLDEVSKTHKEINYQTNIFNFKEFEN
jgi:3'-phosphoadenosine 5'-phosphosulfate sulfotransferase (PAPS reductase)/FAD synthetase